VVYGAGGSQGGADWRGARRRYQSGGDRVHRETGGEENLSNVRTVLGDLTIRGCRRERGCGADAEGVPRDAHPAIVMKAVRAALRPGAKVGIIDRNGNGANHGLNHDVVVKEMADAGYRLVGTYTLTKADGQDYFLIFQVQ